MNMKTKLSIDGQIQNLKEKNILFDKYSENDARKFLINNNYFFKLKSYAHNYTKYSKVSQNHKYINLDFAYLVELSTLDMYLRKWIINVCLDIEHILKTRFLNDITNNPKEDGYNIVQNYINEKGYSVLSNLYSNIGKSATSELIKSFQKDEEQIPVWSFIETLSFGKFIELYNMYYDIYGGKSYKSYLGSIKFLRNTAAHNTCLLNSMRKPYHIKISKCRDIMNQLAKINKLGTSYKKKMENPVVHDFVVLLFVYCDILKTPANRHMRDKGMEELKNLFYTRMLRNKNYFIHNDILVENYKFICAIIRYLDNNNKIILEK